MKNDNKKWVKMLKVYEIVCFLHDPPLKENVLYTQFNEPPSPKRYNTIQ